MLPTFMVLMTQVLFATPQGTTDPAPARRSAELRRVRAAATRFVEALEPASMILEADVFQQRSVRPVVALFTRAGATTAVPGELHYYIHNWRVGEGPCASRVLSIEHASFQLIHPGVTFFVLRPPPLPLAGRCASARSVTLGVSFRPRPTRDAARSPRAIQAWRTLYLEVVAPTRDQDATARRSGATKIAAPATSACAGPLCAAVEAAVQRGLGDLQRCYELQLLRDPRLEGRLVLEWSITRRGRARRVKAVDTSLASPEAVRCIVRVVSTWRFVGAPAARVRYPLRFAPVP